MDGIYITKPSRPSSTIIPNNDTNNENVLENEILNVKDSTVQDNLKINNI